MRIPLDYYRILGLPIQATSEQLQQAHRDRTLQLPRREYSEAAIAARRQLIDEAFAVLSDSTQRQAYDANFLAKAYEVDGDRRSEAGGENGTGGVAVATDPIAESYTPSIEIEDDQLVGALLILLELGEYELVLKLGRPYLSSGSKRYAYAAQPANQASDLVQADIVLTLAFACLELGREQWQQGQYENAAESLETGQELLLREGGFASVRGEIQADLFKLRPYRVLELLALPETSVSDRKQGLNLLQDMLQDRGGIDGSGDDHSGLSTDDFLRFIQQLRSYLTAAEQQTLFEAEARRPSAVATYLAVYALLARGFGDREPALIRRAKVLLVRLGTRQDVHLEQAVCALLLGQTEEASRALELSHEYESLAFIREHSQGSPDLLPGLCLYSERWLQNEVFPHFRDLARREASLKDYFADQQVQAYLEELPNEPEAANQWTVVQATPAKRSTSAAIDPPVNDRNGTVPMPSAERISQTPIAPLPVEVGERPQSRPRQAAVRRRSSPRFDRLALMVLLGILGIGIFGFLASRTFAWLGNALNPGPQLEGEQLDIGVSQPPIALPSSPAAIDPTAPLTTESAQQILETWLEAKSAAMGENHDRAQLATILTDPALSQWQKNVDDAERDGQYFEYEHEVNVTGVEADTNNPDEATIEAEVTEAANLFEDGQPSSDGSRNDRLQIRYELVRQDGQWRIKAWTVQ
ncbi:DUF4101 domain-containing protein [Microcoleus sp. FACHB-1515]|uniref:IMS domain-containing protein n=1 Tax=Microcoleus sp. FACHB-1515 TaxID=2692821 RepID=UPI001688DD41|nr:IMS domain-containing protein [Microcoleus sp. FACHB-1515]MBD2091954.1 DUF4101 domain-containing protein [Microcoleus sp. FACHB-1515]